MDRWTTCLRASFDIAVLPVLLCCGWILCAPRTVYVDGGGASRVIAVTKPGPGYRAAVDGSASIAGRGPRGDRRLPGVLACVRAAIAEGAARPRLPDALTAL